MIPLLGDTESRQIPRDRKQSVAVGDEEEGNEVIAPWVQFQF